MESKVKIAGHPLHPMLVAFPVASYTAALVAFVVYAVDGAAFWWRVGLWANLVGVCMALVAALPGFVDLFAAIPKRHPAKRTGLAHMGLNLGALTLFAANLVAQRGSWTQMPADLRETLGVSQLVRPDVPIACALCGGGVALMLAAGFLGWTLVQKHHVGLPDDYVVPAARVHHPTPARPLGSR